MRLRDKIRYQPNHTYEMIELLQRTDRPIGLFGAGLYARIIKKSLDVFNIPIQFMTVDDAYLTTAERSGDVPLLSICECNERYSDAYIIIAFEYRIENEFHMMRRLSRKMATGIDLIWFDNVHFLHLASMDYPFVARNILKFEETYDMLQDGLSRKIMVEAMNAWISGDSHRLAPLRTDDENDYELDLIFSKEKTGVIIDCGAFDGRSAIQLARYSKGRHLVYAMEFDETNYDVLTKNVSSFPEIVAVKKGVGSSDCSVLISGSGGTTFIEHDDLATEISDGRLAEIVKLDSLFEDEAVFSVVMDIEGSELDALKGMSEIIRRSHPVLGIRIYHRQEDLITIPQFLRTFFDEGEKYKLYLRNNFIGGSRGPYDITLYAL